MKNLKHLLKNKFVMFALIALLAYCTYMFLQKQGILEKFTNKKKMVFCLASWCGHCKNLKQSGEIEKLKKNKDINVEVNEDDEKADKKYGAKGFPFIALVNNGKQIPYEGERTAQAFASFYHKN